MRVAPSLVLAASLVASANPAIAAEKVLAPSTDWQFSISQQESRREGSTYKQCRVARQFGEGRDSVILEFTHLSGPFFSMQLAGYPIGKIRNERFEAQFGPHEGAIERGAFFAKSDQGEPMLLLYGMTLAPAAPEDALDGKDRFAELDAKRQSAIEWLRLESGDEAVQLQTGEIFGAFAALDSCIDAVGRRGEPPKTVLKGKASPPIPASNPADWFRTSDVPKEIAPQPIDGLATVKLSVDIEGRVSGCEVSMATSGYKTLGVETCRTLSDRAVFFPARDEAGQPVESEYTQSVRLEVSR